jgi:hypothetical protein
MSTSFKIFLTTLVLTIIWIIIGIIFVPIRSINRFSNYYYLSIAYAIFFFLPVSILLFSKSRRLRIISWIFFMFSVFAVICACFFYFAISDFQRNATLFSVIYSIPMYFDFVFLNLLFWRRFNVMLFIKN